MLNEIEFIEKYLNIKLTPHQKILLKILKKNKDGYIKIPRHSNERTIRLIYQVLKGEILNDNK